MRTAASSEALPWPDGPDLRRAGPSAQIPDIDAVIKALPITLRSLVVDDSADSAAARAAQLTRCTFGFAAHIERTKLRGEGRASHAAPPSPGLARFEPVRPE